MLLNVVVVLVIVCFTTIEAQKTYQYRSNFPVRLQWYENHGYCGETSLITAGLNLGGLYMSQYDARSECVGSGNQATKEMLLGDGSDVRGAKAMKLVYESFDAYDQTSTEQYLVWVKQHVLQGHLVIIGVYNNEFIFYGDNDPNAGDPTYDHICPVLSIKSNHPLDPEDDTYYPDDEIVFSDNGLYTPDGTIPYKFAYTFADFAMSRQQANAQNGPVYALPKINFNPALAILKVKDPERELKPVTLKTDPIWEKPTIKEGSSTRPKSMPLTITANVTALTKGRTYNCYEYNKLSKVPDRNFNANAKNARKKHTFTAKSSNQVLKFNIKSSDVFVLRCVDSKQKRRLREEPEELEREEKENSVELVV